MLRAVKVRLYPTPEQEAALMRQFGAVRFVYNRALHTKSHYYKVKGQSLHPVYDLKKILPLAKKNKRYAWLKEYDSISLQEACRNLNVAFINFFKGRAKYPRFKSKRGPQSSYHCTGQMSVGERFVRVPKIGRINARVHRLFEGNVKSITLTQSATGRYYASVLMDDGRQDPDVPARVSHAQVRSIDVNLGDIVDDTGSKVKMPRALKKHQKALRRKSKALSRKIKGSGNWKRAKLALARQHEKVRFAREDFSHQVSHIYTRDNQAMCVEGLNIKGMMKNKRLAKHIADAGWGALLAKIAYKCAQRGVAFVKIDKWVASTKTCHACLEKTDISLKTRVWTCKCGCVHDRDVNAALNIKREGIKILRANGLRVLSGGGLGQTCVLQAPTNEAQTSSSSSV